MIDFVSVLIPAYNAEATLAETLDSVLKQTHSEIEVLVIDDGSTDRTSAIAKEFSRKDNRCRCIQQANAGQPNALNRGINEAQGEFITVIDADDLYDPTKMKKQLHVLHTSGCDVVLTQFQRFKVEDSRVVYTSRTDPPEFKNRSDYLRTLIFASRYQMYLFNTALVRASCLKQAGGFDANLPTARDWDMWLRLALFCSFSNVQEPLHFYRKHPGSYSLSHSIYRTLHAHWQILGKMREVRALSTRDLANAERSRLYEHVRILLYRGEIGAALRMLGEGCRSHHLYLNRTFYELLYEGIRRNVFSSS
ncbi:MAG: glycosyltransferase [Deltaproteobacteria bacterium]